MSLSRDELVKLILNNSDIKTAEDIQNTLKDLFGGLLQQMLEGVPPTFPTKPTLRQKVDEKSNFHPL
ncbi:hypothetical protein [Clostridium sp.]|uniref:hypothetical protein n=1 Tax=Clostridium sp. TaxID=1506 RepID=UPI00284DFB66|nr:hypothetical protein [Clostridium sp.]MDR3597925.1 hypothetical protein [Clostridium sp.]